MSNETIGERIKKLREQKGITLTELAKELDIQKSALSYMENDSRSPKSDLIIRICDYFNVSADYLLGRTEYRFPDLNLNKALEMTGLSNESVELLSFVKDEYLKIDESLLNDNDTYSAFCEALNSFISNGGFISLIMHYKKYLNEKSYIQFDKDRKILNVTNNGVELVEFGYLLDDGICDRMVFAKYKCEEQFRRMLNPLRSTRNTDKEQLREYLSGLVQDANDYLEIEEARKYLLENDNEFFEDGVFFGNDQKEE